MKGFSLQLALVGAFTLTTVAVAGPQRYQVSPKNVTAYSTGGTFTLVGSFGQPPAVLLRGGSFGLAHAFFGVAVAVQQDGAPLLKVRQVGDTIVIRWPATLAGYQLETNPSLDADVPWYPAGFQAILLNSEYTVTLPAESGYQFFRLNAP